MFCPAWSLTPSDPGSLPSPSTANSSKLIRSWGYCRLSGADFGVPSTNSDVIVSHRQLHVRQYQIQRLATLNDELTAANARQLISGWPDLVLMRPLRPVMPPISADHGF